MQTEMPLLGDTRRPQYQHAPKEIAACGSMSAAVWRALMHAGMTQEEAALRLDMTPGYMSLMLNGRRNWPESVIRKVVTITGSLAPVQWLCAQYGGEFYVDPVQSERAQLRARLAELDRQDSEAA